MGNCVVANMMKPDEQFIKDAIYGTSLLHMRNKIVETARDQISSGWIEISDPAMVDTIVSTYGNALNRKILNSCATKPHTMMEILKAIKTPQTTGYRRTIYLIKGQFLFSHHEVQSGGKRIRRYLSTFKEVEFHISKDQELIRVKFQNSWQNYTKKKAIPCQAYS